MYNINVERRQSERWLVGQNWGEKKQKRDQGRSEGGYPKQDHGSGSIEQVPFCKRDYAI